MNPKTGVAVIHLGHLGLQLRLLLWVQLWSFYQKMGKLVILQCPQTLVNPPLKVIFPAFLTSLVDRDCPVTVDYPKVPIDPENTGNRYYDIVYIYMCKINELFFHNHSSNYGDEHVVDSEWKLSTNENRWCLMVVMEQMIIKIWIVLYYIILCYVMLYYIIIYIYMYYIYIWKLYNQQKIRF